MSTISAHPNSITPASEFRAKRISKNFAAAKGIAALTVMTGHFSHIPNFWIVVTVGLLIFTISSGYFTWERYHSHFSTSRFWLGKISRLIPHLFVIESFLLCLFIYEGHQGRMDMAHNHKHTRIKWFSELTSHR